MLMVDFARYKAMMMANPDRDLCRGDREGKEDEDLPCNIVEILRKCDEIDIRRIQHQFDRQQDDDDVPAKQDADEPGQEYDAAETSVIRQGNHRRPRDVVKRET